MSLYRIASPEDCD